MIEGGEGVVLGTLVHVPNRKKKRDWDVGKLDGVEHETDPIPYKANLHFSLAARKEGEFKDERGDKTATTGGGLKERCEDQKTDSPHSRFYPKHHFLLRAKREAVKRDPWNQFGKGRNVDYSRRGGQK